MTNRIRLLITVLLVVAVIFVCVSYHQVDLLFTVFRAAQAAVEIILSLAFCATVLLSLFVCPLWEAADAPKRKSLKRPIVLKQSSAPLIC